MASLLYPLALAWESPWIEPRWPVIVQMKLALIRQLVEEITYDIRYPTTRLADPLR
jgi:hypothetical protein